MATAPIAARHLRVGDQLTGANTPVSQVAPHEGVLIVLSDQEAVVFRPDQRVYVQVPDDAFDERFHCATCRDLWGVVERDPRKPSAWEDSQEDTT